MSSLGRMTNTFSKQIRQGGGVDKGTGRGTQECTVQSMVHLALRFHALGLPKKSDPGSRSPQKATGRQSLFLR